MGEENNSSTASSAVSAGTGSKAVSQHTPGPWVAVSVSGFRDHGAHPPIFADGYWHILQADQPEKNPVAIVDHANDHHPPTRAKAAADARLIAAAPDLLEALRLIEGGWVGDEIAEDDHEACVVALQKIAREALSKSQAAAVAKPRTGKG